jgi:hypothetical protein
MLDILNAAEADLPRLLASPSAWQSLKIDYHPPFVDRLWCAWGAYRLYLHRIHPCTPAEALFHPHPWPSAMRVHSGTYELGLGYGAGETPPPIAARMIAGGPLAYEMTDPDAWHYVRPIGGVAITVMVSGTPWARSTPANARSDRPLSPLGPDVIEELLRVYRTVYGAVTTSA